ncbi:PEP-CTERM sorting domain-containing protein [Armatimonas sp.]|uniref:PEP-CTERM sorting domain-containing protein n=1 Tax=Armatimonas sp. TaxID=1872638 RepID=UPI003752BE6D
MVVNGGGGAGGSSDTDYASGIGIGGNFSSDPIGNGGNGRIVLIYSSSAPEPGTLAFLALGMVGGIVARRKK